MESTFCHNKIHKLSCGHTFHTDCIMSWFRSKKNTCPYCRCTGTKSEPILFINNNTVELIQDGWESNEHVQYFLNNENVSKDQTIEAYYIRDINMGHDIDHVFNSCVRGMSINPGEFEKQIQSEFKRTNEQLFKLFIKNIIDNPSEIKQFQISLSFNVYLLNQLKSERYKNKLKMYNDMENMKNANNHSGIYSLIDLNNLSALGW